MRRVLPSVLVVIATLLAFLAIFSLWANRQLLDTDNWTETSSEVLQNQDVQEQLSIFLVDELYTNVDVQARIQEALPPRADVLAGPAAGGLKGLLEDAVDALLDRPIPQEAWEDANRAAHERFLQIVEDEGEAVSTAGGDVVLDLKVAPAADGGACGHRRSSRGEDPGGCRSAHGHEIRPVGAGPGHSRSDEGDRDRAPDSRVRPVRTRDLPGAGPAPGNPAGMRYRVHSCRRGCAPGAIVRG